MFTRLGYFVIIAILAVAGAAIAIVLWSAVGPSDGKSPSGPASTATAQIAASVTVSPAADQPAIPFARVIDFARAGAVLSIDARDADVTVTFREDFDTSGFNTASHVFRSSVEPGQDVVQVLEDAGVAVNRSGGVTVNKR